MAQTDGAAAQGVIVAIHGSVVEARFDGRLPPIRTLLRAGTAGAIAMEVLAPCPISER